MSGGNLKPLSKKHQAFIDQYFICHFNGTEAYMRVYKPKGGRAVARANASDLLAIPNIAEAIQTRLSEVHMSADEALKLLADQARGDIAEVMEIYSTGFNLDMQKAKDAGLTKLIHKVRQKTTTIIGKNESDDDKEITELEVELYDAQAALRDILKIHGKFIDKRQVSGTGENGEIVTKNIIEIIDHKNG